MHINREKCSLVGILTFEEEEEEEEEEEKDFTCQT